MAMARIGTASHLMIALIPRFSFSNSTEAFHGAWLESHGFTGCAFTAPQKVRSTIREKDSIKRVLRKSEMRNPPTIIAQDIFPFLGSTGTDTAPGSLTVARVIGS